MKTGIETSIDPRAVVMPGAELDHGVVVGSHAVIGPRVRIGSGSRIGPNTVIMGITIMGTDNQVLPFSSLGGDPQDLKYRGEDTEVIIGNGNVFGECCTVHRGTTTGRGLTRIGDNNVFMACAHVAHDSTVGCGVRFESGANPGGHVDVEDGAHLGSFSSVHPFCRIGKLASLERGCIVVKDIPPFCAARGDRAELVGLNVAGLKEARYSGKSISSLQDAFDTIFRKGLLLNDALAGIRSSGDATPEVEHLMEFLLSGRRGFAR